MSGTTSSADDLVDIYSSTIDASITLEMLENLSCGVRFPRIRGIGTANYAHGAYPMLPLAEAVQKYTGAIERQRSSKISPRSYSIPDFIASRSGISIAKDSDCDEGIIVGVAEAAGKSDAFPKMRDDSALVDVETFSVTSQEEAEALADKIIAVMRREFVAEKMRVIRFDGDIVFATD
jgi:hypothetical protein